MVIKKSGRPSHKIDSPLDLYNLKNEKTQYNKSIKIKESLYNILKDIVEHNKEIRSVNDAIYDLLIVVATVKMGEKK